MAKRKSSQSTENKSVAIRQYKMENPEAKPKEIASVLAKQGLDVSPQYVSTILSNERRKTGISGSAAFLGAAKFSMDDMYLAKQLVSNTGSVKSAHQAIEVFSRLLT